MVFSYGGGSHSMQGSNSYYNPEYNNYNNPRRNGNHPANPQGNVNLSARSNPQPVHSAASNPRSPMPGHPYGNSQGSSTKEALMGPGHTSFLTNERQMLREQAQKSDNYILDGIVPDDSKFPSMSH